MLNMPNFALFALSVRLFRCMTAVVPAPILAWMIVGEVAKTFIF